MKGWWNVIKDVIWIPIAIIFMAAVIVGLDQNFKSHCRSKGGHVVSAMGADQVCVDGENRVIQR